MKPDFGLEAAGSQSYRQAIGGFCTLAPQVAAMTEDGPLSEGQRLIREAQEKSQLAEERLEQAEERFRQAEAMMLQAEERLQQVQELLRKVSDGSSEMHRLAYQDELTGLPNLNILRQHLDLTLKHVHRYEKAAALLVVDLDRLRALNEAMGFKVGDKLLIEVAVRLKEAFRDTDVVARKGEDRFLILLSELAERKDLPQEQMAGAVAARAEMVADRLLETLGRPYVVQDQPLLISASIGISTCPGDASSAPEMLEHADAALYRAKQKGRSCWHRYVAESEEGMRRRMLVETHMRTAVSEQQFHLLYLPIVEMTSRQIVGVEALVRWHSPRLGPVEPREFLPIAEESGLIVPIGEWVVSEAARQLRKWKSQAEIDVFVDINLSRRQLLYAGMASRFVAALEEFDVEGQEVVVDVSEDSFTRNPTIRMVLSQLGESGVRVAIDDFGTGLSSLKGIRLAPTKILKVDRSFVSGLPEDRQNLGICVAVIRLAASLNMRSLAEGIEMDRQYQFLLRNECDLGQGFYFSEPVKPEEIPEMVRRGRPGRQILGISG